MAHLDVIAALRSPTADPDWARKCLIHGLFGLVPLVGPLALFGWQRRIFHARLAGETRLPDPEFVEELREGVAPLLAAMNLVIFVLPMLIVAVGVALYTQSQLGAGFDEDELASTVATLAILVGALEAGALLVALLGQLLLPELLRRGFGGDTTPLFRPAESLERLRRAPKDMLLLVIGVFLANIAGSLGFYLCFVGGILTVPYAGACVADLVARWAAASGG